MSKIRIDKKALQIQKDYSSTSSTSLVAKWNRLWNCYTLRGKAPQVGSVGRMRYLATSRPFCSWLVHHWAHTASALVDAGGRLKFLRIICTKT